MQRKLFAVYLQVVTPVLLKSLRLKEQPFGLGENKGKEKRQEGKCFLMFVKSRNCTDK